jgi:hypothetical protein
MRTDGRFVGAARVAALAAFVGSIGFSLGGMVLMRTAPGAVASAGSLLPWLMKTPT